MSEEIRRRKVYTIKRKYIDMSNLTMNGQYMPIVYVNSNLIWKSNEPGFAHIIQRLEQAPKPGFFLTSGKGEGEVRVRWSLNRHGILSSETFKDSKGQLYRDVDAKGIGYTRGFPAKFLGVRLPEMNGDIEMRGILHNDVATGDCLMTEEVAALGVRIARYAAQVELFELVTQDGRVVPREEVGHELEMRMDSVKPTIAVRAMGATSRVEDLGISKETNDAKYIKEIVDDAINLVSQELGTHLKPEDYVAWFSETMGRQLGTLHRNNVWTDFMAQIHSGQHNLTLDCRLTDTYHYQSINSARRRYEALKKGVERDPRLAYLLEEMFPEHRTEKQIREARENNAKGELIDKETHEFVLKHFLRGVGEIYPLKSLSQDTMKIFNDAYKKARD